MPKWRIIFKLLAGLLVLRVTAAVVLNYRNYFPPNFASDFLQGRERYFFGAYQVAFYTHILSGPVSLVLGLLLVNEPFRRNFPNWHRMLGRVQVALVLLVVAPSGLWMAWYAAAGPVAVVGFSLLAIATWVCTALGWRTAVRRKFAAHRRWMWRSFLLLCSAVVIRVIGGLLVTTGYAPAWADPAAAWGSWLLPLIAFELSERYGRSFSRWMAPSQAGSASVAR